MPELRTARWKRQIEDRHGERGTVLSAEVTEELLAHLEDVYEAQREQGASDEEALAVTDRLVRESTYRDLAVTRRGRLTRSRLPERVPWSWHGRASPPRRRSVDCTTVPAFR